MEACAYKGLPRSLGVGPVHRAPIYRACHGSIEPTPRLLEPVNSGSSLSGVCDSWTSPVYKAMSRP